MAATRATVTPYCCGPAASRLACHQSSSSHAASATSKPPGAAEASRRVVGHKRRQRGVGRLAGARRLERLGGLRRRPCDPKTVQRREAELRPRQFVEMAEQRAIALLVIIAPHRRLQPCDFSRLEAAQIRLPRPRRVGADGAEHKRERENDRPAVHDGPWDRSATTFRPCEAGRLCIRSEATAAAGNGFLEPAHDKAAAPPRG